METDEGIGRHSKDEEQEIEPVPFPVVDPEPDTIAQDEPVSFPVVDPQPDTIAPDEPISFPVVDPQPDDSKG